MDIFQKSNLFQLYSLPNVFNLSIWLNNQKLIPHCTAISIGCIFATIVHKAGSMRLCRIFDI